MTAVTLPLVTDQAAYGFPPFPFAAWSYFVPATLPYGPNEGTMQP